MSPTEAWEAEHARRSWGLWPSEHVVRWVMRTYGHLPAIERRKIGFIDLGCGAGATSFFLASEGFTVDGVDASRSAIARCNTRAEQEFFGGRIQFHVADLCDLPFALHTFDCAIDACSLQHVAIEALGNAMGSAFGVIKPGGKLFSMTMSQDCDTDLPCPSPYRRTTRAGIHPTYHPFLIDEVQKTTFTYNRTQRPGLRTGLVSHWLIEGTRP